jgi:asparagine synthase (glutamine-hydrolysing)
MGTGTVNLAVFFRYHGLYQAAARHGCDMLLSADYGNFTFSASGSWSPAEYLRHLRLRQLWQTLRGERRDGQGFLTRLLVEAVMPVLPDGLWRLGRRLRGLSAEPDNLTVSALRQDAIERYSVSSRAAQAGTEYLRSSHASRADMVRDNFARGDVEGSDIGQGFEQLYEISTRDPTTYGPFVDFCLGLPTEMFRRDGETRWLARELGRGLMPEAQRTMPGHGQHNSDWHLRLTPRLEDMRRDIEAIREDPILAEMIDTQLLLDSLDNWPATQSVDDSVFIPHGFRLPRAVAMGRFVRFMSGRNA